MYKCNCGLNVYAIIALFIIFHVWPSKTKDINNKTHQLQNAKNPSIFKDQK